MSSSCGACSVRRALCADALAFRVEERFCGDRATDPLAEDLRLDSRAGRHRLRRQVGVRDRALDRVAIAAAGDAPDDLAVDANRLGTERDRSWIIEHQAREATRGLVDSEQSVSPDEVAL